MRNRRLTITGLAVIATLGLTACDPSDPGTSSAAPAGAASASAAPIVDGAATELAEAATKLGTEKSVKVAVLMSHGISANGVATGDGSKVDMHLILADATAAQRVRPSITVRKLGDDVWMKLGGSLGSALGAKAGKWLHVDAAQLSDGGTATTGNPADAARMIRATTEVTKTGDNTFKGLLDMTKAPGLDQKAIAALGAKANAVPFTAQTDLKGRLVQLNVDMSELSADAGIVQTNYSDFGTPVTVQAPPAAQVIEMPKELLGLVNA
jgi:hypothetical protein